MYTHFLQMVDVVDMITSELWYADAYQYSKMLDRRANDLIALINNNDSYSVVLFWDRRCGPYLLLCDSFIHQVSPEFKKVQEQVWHSFDVVGRQ